MLGFVEYSKLSMGHEKVQKVDGIFAYSAFITYVIFIGILMITKSA